MADILTRSGQRVHDAIGTPDPAPGLYALQGLVQPVALRFKYHFEGTRATNKLDKVRFFYSRYGLTEHADKRGRPALARMVLHSHPKRRT